MAYCESTWAEAKLTGVTPEEWNQSHQFLVQAPPSLIKILQAIVMEPMRYIFLLVKIHAVLHFSWNELRMVICHSLCSFIGQKRRIANLLIVAGPSGVIGSCMRFGGHAHFLLLRQ
jgi:hypothetical protein